ncbi:hypothetical protein HD806DRAFT_395873 [Xylariaceae sp. AK1471]|nr:hypothetical protein HD806DRAFT_395873 [Xylariaceae sp. AK1471]
MDETTAQRRRLVHSYLVGVHEIEKLFCVGTPDSSQKDLKAILLTHIDNTGLALKDVLNVSNIPKSANETGLLANIEKSLEWFTQSPEFQTWKEKELCTSLWLHGKPGVGKTVVMSYVLQHLPRLLGYAKNWDIAAIFCSNNQSQDLILVSLIFQLIKHNLRVQFARPIIESWDTSLTGFDLSNYLWRVLEAMVTAVPGRETIFLFDGMDSLERAVMSTFLANFLSLERRSAASGAAIRVLISSRPYPYIREALASYASIEPEKERNECLRTLYFQEWNARETRVDDAPQGGNWLPLHQEYREWIKNPVSDLLWIEGKPGSGKSTLTKQIVQKLHDERNVPSQRELNNADLDQHTIIAAFYYSFRGGVTETSHELMLRSIVYQIWSQNTRLFPLLQDSYRRLKLNGDNHSRMGPFWRYEDLKFALQSLHQVNFPLQIFIVADGMDESDNIRRSDLLSFLRNLSLQTSNCIMKVLFASRPETDINLHLQGDHHIILQKENAEDIRKVVMSWCEGLKYHSVPQDNTKEPPSTKSRYPDDFFKVGDYIAENSQGVFLWVSLVIRDLDALIRKGAYTIASLEKRVRKLPKDLGGRNGFYHAIVQSLIRRQDEDEILDEDDKENERRQARKILTWMTFPKRPISMHELEDVLAIPLQIEDKDLRTYDFERHRPRELDRGLISYCGGLLEVRTPIIIALTKSHQRG